MAPYSEKRRAALEATMQDEVLRVASAILQDEGFEALTMDRIAREIGVSRGTLYNYFADADAVLNFVEEQTFAPLKLEAQHIATGGLPPHRKLEAVARASFDFLFRDRALALALFAKQELRGPRAEQRVRHRNEFLGVVEGIVAEGVTSNRLREVPPRLVAEIFLGAIMGCIETMLYSGEFRTADELAPGVMDVLLLGLEPRGRAPGAPHSQPES